MTPTTSILRVLVIDDNQGDRVLIIRELEREFEQLQTQEILDQNDFDRAMAAGGFNVVVTDYQLQWTTGLDILCSIKQRYPTCPVIMFTSSGNEEIAVEAMKAGLDDYVIKASGRYIRLAASVQVALERAEIRRRASLLEIRLQRLLNRLNVGVFRSNAAGELLECNPAYLNLLGADSIANAETLQPLNLQEIYQQLLSVPQQQQEIQLQRMDETLIWVFLNVAIDAIEDEPVVDGLIEDITARKQAELQLRQLNEQLEERVRERTARLEAANRDLEEFAYSISHDLREPLRGIQGFAQVLLENAAEPLSVTQQEYLNRIYNSTQRAEQLIEDLLTYSRLGQAELSLQSVNLSLLISRILTQLRPELRQRQAQVYVEEPLAEVAGNSVLLMQVITNLLTNAIKFVAVGVQPQVRIWTEEIRNADSSLMIRLWVADNGIGIDPEAHQRIFNPFVRLHGEETYPGSGIGLAIVRKGVERLGGRVGVESVLGQGSRFWIEFLGMNDSAI